MQPIALETLKRTSDNLWQHKIEYQFFIDKQKDQQSPILLETKY